MSSESPVPFRPMESCELRGRRVLLRLDINSPIDPQTKRIVSDNRIDKSLPTVNRLLEQGARLAIIAHQGDTLDYRNLIPLEEHAKILSEKTGRKIGYIDDVCGPAAREAVERLKEGEALILGNLRYLGEELSSFEDVVKLSPQEGTETWLVRSLAPLFDLYINDAFAAAHRAAPSMVSFQELLPSAAGPLLFNEVSALTRVMKSPAHPAVFLLGGAKISDAFAMMEQVLKNGTADTILAAGVTGIVFLMASGLEPGEGVRTFLSDRGLLPFVDQAAVLLDSYSDRIKIPLDLAFSSDGERREITATELPGGPEQRGKMYMDIGGETIEDYARILDGAATIFINGPSGVFEDPLFEEGTRRLWQAAAASEAYSVVGGGDSVSAAQRFTDLSGFSYICTAGGAMVRFLSGKRLPLIEAMEASASKDLKNLKAPKEKS